MESKKVWQSKTAWVALLTAVAAFIPPVQKFIADQPQLFAQLVAGLFLGLRLVSKGKIDIKD